MINYAEKYAEASGAKPESIAKFRELNGRIPKLSENPTQAGNEMKRILRGEQGFQYVDGCFTLQDVLRRRGGNCSGLPLLTGTILGERGFEPTFRLGTNPKDYGHTLEQRFFDELRERVFRGELDLADKKVDFPLYRFIPLEHLMVSSDGKTFLEMTSPDEEMPINYERTEEIDFGQALSCVYQDRANRLVSIGDLNRAKKVAERGLNSWANNRQLNSLLASIAKEQNDKAGFKKYLGKFEKIGGDDSLYHSSHYLLTGNVLDLERALDKYPAFAGAIAEEAKTLAKSSPEEARNLFCLASQCYANSNVLNINSFNRVYGKDINELNARLKKPVRGL